MVGLLALWGNPLVRYGMAVAGVLLALFGFYGYAHHRGALSERVVWEGRMKEQAQEAAKLIATRIAENAATEAKSEALNTQLEKDHAEAVRTIDAAHDDYNRAVAGRVRITRSGPSCAAPGSAETTSAGRGENVAAAGIVISEQALRDSGDLAAEADQLVTTMKACQAWAAEHGR